MLLCFNGLIGEYSALRWYILRSYGHIINEPFFTRLKNALIRGEVAKKVVKETDN